jgi:cysteinyl-tRNA synthetase
MKLYNTFTGKKEEFIPIEPHKISIYVCGQTVYDYCHLGHARKEVAFDVIRRWFIASDFEVTFVENITDIDDKIIARALENKETIYQLTKKFINYMHEDFDQLGVLRPDIEPLATDYIEQMVKIISNLVVKGIAYQAKNGDVYYSVKKFTEYGQLSGRNLDDLRAGERVDIDSYKNDPLDFVLWKAAKENEPFWDSEFGRGRPGWHIECSAMAEAILGKQFDIHGGGQDLIFPHHENEIAQSEAHNGCRFANYWLHNGFLNINDETESLLKEWTDEDVRFELLFRGTRDGFTSESFISKCVN